jgi:cytoskeletal protein CcmA (bactofilin family)
MFSSSSKKPQAVGRERPPSILASGLTITGNLVSDGEIQIDGIVEGDVSGRRITLGEHAQVRGEIIADAVLIRGEVAGRIRALAVELARTARVKGDIWHSSLAIESGAQLDGLCKHTDNPLDADRPKQAAIAGPDETRLLAVTGGEKPAEPAAADAEAKATAAAE